MEGRFLLGVQEVPSSNLGGPTKTPFIQFGERLAHHAELGLAVHLKQIGKPPAPEISHALAANLSRRSSRKSSPRHSQGRSEPRGFSDCATVAKQI